MNVQTCPASLSSRLFLWLSSLVATFRGLYAFLESQHPPPGNFTPGHISEFSLNRERSSRIFPFISIIRGRNSRTSEVPSFLFRARPTVLPRQTSDIESRWCSLHFTCLVDSSLNSSHEIYLLLFNLYLSADNSAWQKSNVGRLYS